MLTENTEQFLFFGIMILLILSRSTITITEHSSIDKKRFHARLLCLGVNCSFWAYIGPSCCLSDSIPYLRCKSKVLSSVIILWITKTANGNLHFSLVAGYNDKHGDSHPTQASQQQD